MTYDPKKDGLLFKTYRREARQEVCAELSQTIEAQKTRIQKGPAMLSRADVVRLLGELCEQLRADQEASAELAR